MELTKSISKRNYNAFLWHGGFLAIASSFMDVDTIIPSMLINAGGTSVHVGVLTAILIGGSKLSQLFFAPYINAKEKKRPLLITGIYLRVMALAAMALIFFLYHILPGGFIIGLIFLFMTSFSLGGAFANISYTDILGKSILDEMRKSFLSLRQIITSAGMLVSAWLAGLVLRHYDYPVNYFAVFAIAAATLGIASLGFWRIVEHFVPVVKNYSGIWSSISGELKSNKRLIHYLLLTNTLGLGYALLPFILLLGKENLGMNNDFVSKLLLVKMTGLIVAGVFIYFYSKKIKYNTILIASLVLGVLFPLTAWLFREHETAYFISFFIGGLYGSLFAVSTSGILLEISTHTNRSIYAGISGAGNILPTLMPLLAGVVIAAVGYQSFFIAILLFTLSSIYFIYRLNCLK